MSAAARFLPATDRAGRFSFVKALAWLGALAPGLWLIWTWRTVGLGPKPSSFVIHRFGDFAVWLLVATLCVTPLRTMTRWNALILARRILGNFALFYALAHLSAYAVDVGPGKAISEITLRVYLWIGAAALSMLALLGATSNEAAIRRLGATGWGRVHSLIYAATFLALWHYFLQSKNDVTPALLPAGLYLLLMAWRAWKARRGAPGALAWAGIALGAGVATAALEAGWYFWRSGLSPVMILAGNLDVGYEIRPPLIATAAGLAAAAGALVFSLFPSRTGRARRR